MTLSALPATATRTLEVVPWHQPVVDRLSLDPRGAYVEEFWLPVAGPSACWLLRRLADGLDEHPDGFVIHVEEMSKSLGLGGTVGRHAPFSRALARCAHFGLVQMSAEGRVAVRRCVPGLPQALVLRLPATLQVRHQRWDDVDGLAADLPAARRRTRLLGLDLVELGQDMGDVERRLLRQGVHPALAAESAAWAWERRPAKPGDGQRYEESSSSRVRTPKAVPPLDR